MLIRNRIAALLTLLAGSPAIADDASLADRFAAEFARSGLIAAGFGVQQGDAPPQIMVAGVTAKGTSTPVPMDAAWHIGSITKSFTATLIMMAVADGQLSLDAPLVELLPDHAGQMHPSWHGLTLREMLSHTAGLRENPTLQQRLAAQTSRLDTDAMLAAHWSVPLPETRGQFAYSNLGYILAARVFEEATGTPWEAALRRRIIAPLGLTSFGIGPPDVIRGHRSTFGIGKRSVAPQTDWADNPPIYTPAGRMHLSIADMLRWGRFLLTACEGRSNLLSAAACREMITPVAEGYGLGLAVFTVDGIAGDAWGHDGSNTLWYALLAVMPEEDTVAFAVASEASQRKVSQLGLTMLRAAMGR